MNYGFLIRNDRCIGCHACSTACKSENEVPLGVNRTWVKSVETGAYPNVSRHFQVTRCNHCANPPCVRICPVTAMYQRDDGIVEFDAEVCIGCKACLQACPYDAIYVDPESGTAAKCHYCAHRVEMNLEPACVVVCPEHAIIAGDLDDPLTEISQMIAANQVTVRKPEQGTAPKLFYVDGEETNLTPTAVERTPTTFMWADVLPLHENGDTKRRRKKAEPQPRHEKKRRSASGTVLRSGQKQGLPLGGPVSLGNGKLAEQMVQVAYNAQHEIPWHWPVPAYLVTKGIASGLFLILAFGLGIGLLPFDLPAFVAGGTLTLAFLMITTALLVYDLERPERFIRILTRPQWKSWLVRGAFILIAFSTITGIWWVLETGALLGWWSEAGSTLRRTLLWTGVPLAFGTAVYTAFLFGQAEGRDLWQSALLPLHLIVQALVCGFASILVMDLFMYLPEEYSSLARVGFGVAVFTDLLVMLVGEFGMPHASEAAAQAAKLITHGRYARRFWWGSIVVGHLIPLGVLLTDATLPLTLGAVMAIVGLYVYEHLFVTAAQEIPNS